MVAQRGTVSFVSSPPLIHVASRPLSPCCARFPRTCRAFSGSVLSRWLLSQRHREGGVLRLVRSIAIKDLVTRLGAALRSASSSLYIALARCVKQFICIEANAPEVVALHTSLSLIFSSFSLFLFLSSSPGRCGLAGSLTLVSTTRIACVPILWARAYLPKRISSTRYTRNMYICVSAWSYFFPE